MLLKKVENYLLGKIYLYSANAIHDYTLAKQLDSYLKKKRLSENFYPRTKIFISEAKNKTHSEEFLIAISYTLIYWNGLYDYLYAQLLSHLVPHKKDQIKKNISKYFSNKAITFYQKGNYSPISMLSRILALLTGTMPHLENKEVSLKDVLPGMIYVQKVNIENNKKLAKLISNGQIDKNEKLQKLYTISQSKDFLRGVKQTLLDASRWDRLFVLILKIRFNKYL